MNESGLAELIELESVRPGHKQLQRSGVDWLALQVRLGRLKRLDLTVWLIVAGRASLRTGLAEITAQDLADYLLYAHRDVPVECLDRLQRAGALLRLKAGLYLLNPMLLRSGSPGRHGMLLNAWWKAWDESRWAKQQRQAQPA